ncbi:hypothetical protein PRIPAC_96036 [Pristionchus pacificus]|uniref:G protein-coupled receptor n=1 Tax=Pristionchus pacificus TaxID=54126 RepID=A0A2A6D1P4_PRIPA|nr:hypothetical protein PRIPAC_96036 [Pristionchus pacificus]|eukprot:PDM84402.1 G protein-coupled receptor [Pristionchus pacificus]
MASSATPVFVLIYASITIQQALSTWKKPLRVRIIMARICICVAYGYVIVYGFFVYRNEQFTGKTAFCSSYTSHSDILILTNLNVMMVLGVINFLSAIFLLRYNKKVVSDESKSFELSRKFQRVRNLYAAEQFIIIVALHSATHFIHFCLYSFTFYYRPYYTQTQFTILHAVVNIIPYYCLVGPLTFLILIKLGRFRRNDHVRSMIATMHNSNAQEVYFKGLRDAWNQ